MNYAIISLSAILLHFFLISVACHHNSMKNQFLQFYLRAQPRTHNQTGCGGRASISHHQHHQRALHKFIQSSSDLNVIVPQPCSHLHHLVYDYDGAMIELKTAPSFLLIYNICVRLLCEFCCNCIKIVHKCREQHCSTLNSIQHSLKL